MAEKEEWVGESIVPGWRHEMKVGKWLTDTSSDFHSQIAVFECVENGMGRVLVLEDRIQLTSRDEFSYHEMFAHVPLMLLGASAKESASSLEFKVLIIGGGDGATLREVVKHKNVRATLVDIDKEVINCSKQYLPSLHQGSFDHERSTVIVGDGIKFVKETDERFDVVIIDSTDPEDDGPSAILYQAEFYQQCRRVLRDATRGFVVTQNGHPQFEKYPVIGLSHLAEVFEATTVYQFSVPTYMGGLQTFGIGTADMQLFNVDVEKARDWWQSTGITDCQHFTPAYGAASFVLPKWVADHVEEANKLAKATKAK